MEVINKKRIIRDQGLGIGVWGLGCRGVGSHTLGVQASGSSDESSRVERLRFGVQGAGCRVQGAS